MNAFELRGFENPVSANQSEQKAFVFELSNDLLIGLSAVRLSSRKHSLSFEPHYSRCEEEENGFCMLALGPFSPKIYSFFIQLFIFRALVYRRIHMSGWSYI